MAGPIAAETLLPGSRLFHIGPPKTGTTALQWMASELRNELLANGVRYPGRTRNHRLAVSAFLGRSTGWNDGSGRRAAPPIRHWYELLGELEAERSRRTWFGHEYAAHAAPAQIERFAAQLGPSLQVVITLRGFARMLPSMWQERLKAGGSSAAFEPWLRKMLRPRRPADVARRERHDHGGLVERWAEQLGAERVTVVILDPDDHGFVFGAFENLLGLPTGLLTSKPFPAGVNRSLTVPEVELLRRLNQITRAQGLPWTNHERLVVQGAVARLLAGSTAAEPVRLPGWAVPLANEVADRNAERITASGVRIVGEAANLAEPALAEPVKDHRDTRSVPLEVAVEALAGLLAAATGHDSDFRRNPDRTGRQVLLHVADDLQALRQVGVLPVVRSGAVRAVRAAGGVGYAAKGWVAAKRGRAE